MKKLCRKGTVHPSPPLISDHLAFLPAAIFTLTVALCQEDKEVLAYLISCSPGNLMANRKTNSSNAACGGDHPTCFNCNCFSCYMSYWVRWDSSPNRQLIHEIIDAYEDGLQLQTKKLEKKKREKRRNKTNNNSNKGSGSPGEVKNKSEVSLNKGESDESVSVEERRSDGGEDSNGEDEGGEKGAVRRFVSSLGERIWATIWT